MIYSTSVTSFSDHTVTPTLGLNFWNPERDGIVPSPHSRHTLPGIMYISVLWGALNKNIKTNCTTYDINILTKLCMLCACRIHPIRVIVEVKIKAD